MNGEVSSVKIIIQIHLRHFYIIYSKFLFCTTRPLRGQESNIKSQARNKGETAQHRWWQQHFIRSYDRSCPITCSYGPIFFKGSFFWLLILTFICSATLNRVNLSTCGSLFGTVEWFAKLRSVELQKFLERCVIYSFQALVCANIIGRPCSLNSNCRNASEASSAFCVYMCDIYFDR